MPSAVRDLVTCSAAFFKDLFTRKNEVWMTQTPSYTRLTHRLRSLEEKHLEKGRTRTKLMGESLKFRRKSFEVLSSR